MVGVVDGVVVTMLRVGDGFIITKVLYPSYIVRVIHRGEV